MWINSVFKYKLLKSIKKDLSKRSIFLIKNNLNLSIIYKLLPINIRSNEQMLHDLLYRFKDVKIQSLKLKYFNDFSLPFNNKKVARLYKDISINELIFISSFSSQVDLGLLVFNEIKSLKDLISGVLYIKNKLDISDDIQTETKDTLRILDGHSFEWNHSSYKLKSLTNSNDISVWSVYLNNCLDLYCKNKTMKIKCKKSNVVEKVSMKTCLNLNILNIFGIYKNGKPFACIEFIDKQDFVNQFLSKKNRALALTEQHNILTHLDKILSKELFWVETAANYD